MSNNYKYADISETHNCSHGFLVIPLRHWVPCGGLDNYRYQLSEFLSDVRKPEQRGGCQIVITRN